MGKVIPFKRPVVTLRVTVPEDFAEQIDLALEKYERLLTYHKADYDRAAPEDRPAIAAAIRDIEWSIDQARQLQKDKSK